MDGPDTILRIDWLYSMDEIFDSVFLKEKISEDTEAKKLGSTKIIFREV